VHIPCISAPRSTSFWKEHENFQSFSVRVRTRVLALFALQQKRTVLFLELRRLSPRTKTSFSELQNPSNIPQLRDVVQGSRLFKVQFCDPNHLPAPGFDDISKSPPDKRHMGVHRARFPTNSVRACARGSGPRRSGTVHALHLCIYTRA
jgi:hypothetical protein